MIHPETHSRQRNSGLRTITNRHAAKPLSGIRRCSQGAAVVLLILAALHFGAGTATGQGVGFNNANPHASAILDLKATDRGLLIPRMSTSDRTGNITTPATGLLVYDTDLKAFYFYNGSAWVALSSAATGWGVTGNSGTQDTTNFIGTTNAENLDIRTANTLRVRITQKGQIETFNTGQSVFIGEGAGAADDLTNNINVFVGYQAGNKNTSGSYNTAIGSYALNSNLDGFQNTATGSGALGETTTGSYNTANGREALYSNTTGSYNTANGLEALFSNKTGSNATAIGYGAMYYANNTTTAFTNYNVAVGYEAMRGSTSAGSNTGNDNTAVGYQALYSYTTGSYNTANGYRALFSNTTGYDNTANGYGALANNESGFRNTANGAYALVSNIDGDGNMANGFWALYNNTTGDNNTANGREALYSNTTGSYNTANGLEALYSNKTGSNATAIGYGAMYYANNTTTAFTNYNVAVGYEAMRGSTSAGSNTGNYNTALGYQALMNYTTGANNTANGYGALYTNTEGTGNTANGREALYSNLDGDQNTANGYAALYDNTTGDNNTANGFAALVSNTTGYSNVAVGVNALFSNTDKSNLVAVGDSALYNNTTGTANVAVGSKALYTNESGNANTANGFQALALNTTGENNTALGAAAGDFNTTGSSNTFVGYEADATSPALINATAIGANASVSASNKIQLGNGSVTSVATAGKFSLEQSVNDEMVIINDDLWTDALGFSQDFGDGGAHFIMASKEGSVETAGIYGDGDHVTIWSAGDGAPGLAAAYLYILDEDYWSDGDTDPFDNSALKIYLNSSGTWVASDRNRKENIDPLPKGSLSKLIQLSGYSYNFKLHPAEIEKGDTKKKTYGVIAQEVAQVFPEIVDIFDDGSHFVNYSLFVPVLIESVKEQQTIIDGQKEEINVLHAQITEIQQTLKAMGSE